MVVDETAPRVSTVITAQHPTLGPIADERPMSTPATTPLLRPISARPQTAASSLHPEGHSIVALLEGRGISREIGMATLNPETGRATIVQVSIYPGFLPTEPERNPLIPLGIQLSDLPTYVKTLHQMHIHYPSLVLVPDTFISSHSSSDAKTSLLIDCIEGEFEGVPIEPVKRKYWNETTGRSSYSCRDGPPSLRQFIQASSLSHNFLWMTRKEPPPFFRLPPSLVARDLRICAWTKNEIADIMPSRLYAPFSNIRR